MLLQSFIYTLYQVFLPISFPIIAGALLKKLQGLETKSLSIIALYVLGPGLIFNALYKAELSYSDMYKTLAFSVLNLGLLWGISVLCARIFSLSNEERSGLTLASAFTNSINYGLPLVLLAFGKIGLDKASVYVIIQTLIVNTLGIYFAARSHFTIRQAIRSIFKMPTVYAAAAALLLRLLHTGLPGVVDQGVIMLANAYSPVVLCILGAQMMSMRSAALPRTKALYIGLIVRLLAAPFIASAILYALGVNGVLFAVLMILASMPSAVNSVMLAEQFHSAPKLVSKCILWSTLASFILLPILIRILS
ncbi:MAG TPA: AEC family transporter [Bryobacteraceae bacterium]